jgi:hypothetical protein
MGLQCYSVSNYRRIILATPNYGYEKRQKELAKKQKKAEKLKEKNDRKVNGFTDEPDAAESSDTEGAAPGAPDAP